MSKHATSHLIRPYGDATGDGQVQVSFTLPIAHDKRAEGAALQLASKMGLEPAMVVHAKQMGPHFTFFVVYGRCSHLVDLDKVVVMEREFPLLSPKEVSAAVKRELRRPLVVIGACIGTDAHTVGIDAILNIKGWAGEKGLEAYSGVEVHNLGAQVSVPDLVEHAQNLKADAVLVSQVVTQREAHLHNVTQMSAAFREAYPAGTAPVLIVGDHVSMRALPPSWGRPHLRQGHDPGIVASYLVHRLCAPPGSTGRSTSKQKRTAKPKTKTKKKANAKPSSKKKAETKRRGGV